MDFIHLVFDAVNSEACDFFNVLIAQVDRAGLS